MQHTYQGFFNVYLEFLVLEPNSPFLELFDFISSVYFPLQKQKI